MRIDWLINLWLIKLIRSLCANHRRLNGTWPGILTSLTSLSRNTRTDHIIRTFRQIFLDPHFLISTVRISFENILTTIFGVQCFARVIAVSSWNDWNQFFKQLEILVATASHCTCPAERFDHPEYRPCLPESASPEVFWIYKIPNEINSSGNWIRLYINLHSSILDRHDQQWIFGLATKANRNSLFPELLLTEDATH